jgi:hypothetical protein
MPNVTEFRWNWRDKETRPSASDLQYLAACRFHPACDFYLEFDHDYIGLSSEKAEALNPLFLNHRGGCIELCRVRVSPTSTVLLQAEKVTFQVGLPPPELFESHQLPELIVFFMLNAEEAEDLWPILDTLLRSEHEHSMYMQMEIHGQPIGGPHHPDRGNILWERSPEERVDESIMAVTYRLMQYARELAKKGIVIFDKVGLPFDPDCSVVLDEIFEEKWSYLY